MPAQRRRRPARRRVGRVSIYLHHGTWWVYYRQDGRQVRRKAGNCEADAEQIAAQVNAQLVSGAPTLFSFVPVSVAELLRRFLGYHDATLNSSVATISRYRAATLHLERFAQIEGVSQAHQVRADAFVAYLRGIEIAPNGHPHTKRRKLREKGIQFILETCRAMYNFAGKRRHLPPYAGNPFSDIPFDRLKITDAKPIYVFSAEAELDFFRLADDWAFPIHLFLSQTGLRPGELTHVLIEDVDLKCGWVHIRNKPNLGWRIKTGCERAVPIMSEVAAVLRRVIGNRQAGPVFLRQTLAKGRQPLLVGGQRALEAIFEERQQNFPGPLSRAQRLRIARTVWRDAGAVKTDAVRTSFIRIMRRIGEPDATCPKSWRHSFATVLQIANVDPLVRQITLGHRPQDGGGLGMTAHYTHTSRETQREQIEEALRRRPLVLSVALRWAHGGKQ